MAAPELEVVELTAKHTAIRLTELIEMIRGLANPKSGGARREVHSNPSDNGDPTMGLFVASHGLVTATKNVLRARE